MQSSPPACGGKARIFALAAVAVVLLLLGGAMVLYSSLLVLAPKTYRSSVRMKAQEPGWFADTTWDSSGCTMSSEFDRIRSPRILFPVITNLDLNTKWAQKFQEQEPLKIDMTYEMLKSQVDACQVRSTSLGEISARSEDPIEAAAIANAIAEEYRRHCLDLQRETIFNRMTSISNAVYQQEQKIAAVQKQLAQPNPEMGATNRLQRELDNLKHMEKLLQQKLAEETITLNALQPAVEILDRAEPSFRPIFPDKRKMTAGFILGLISAGLGIGFLTKALLNLRAPTTHD